MKNFTNTTSNSQLKMIHEFAKTQLGIFKIVAIVYVSKTLSSPHRLYSVSVQVTVQLLTLNNVIKWHGLLSSADPAICMEAG